MSGCRSGIKRPTSASRHATSKSLWLSRASHARAPAMRILSRKQLLLSLITLSVEVLVAACTQSTTFVAAKPRNYPADSVEGTAHKLGVVQGFYGPESVRYSPGQDVYFVSVMNGPGSEKDDNGYIVQIDAGNLG